MLCIRSRIYQVKESCIKINTKKVNKEFCIELSTLYTVCTLLH